MPAKNRINSERIEMRVSLKRKLVRAIRLGPRKDENLPNML